MNSLLVVLSMVAMASAIPMSYKTIPIAIGYQQVSQASSYRLKTDHPVMEPAPIIKGVPQPYAVPVPQPYAVPRAVPVEVPRAVPVTVTRTVPVPIVATGEPIVRTRVIQAERSDLGGYGGYGGYGSLSLGEGLGDNGYGDNGYGLGLKTISLGSLEGLGGLSKY